MEYHPERNFDQPIKAIGNRSWRAMMAVQFLRNIKTKAARVEHPVARFALGPVRGAYRAVRWAKYCLDGTCDRRNLRLAQLEEMVQHQQQVLQGLVQTPDGPPSSASSGSVSSPAESGMPAGQSTIPQWPSVAGFAKPYRLHVGCYANYWDGWINLDLEAGPNRVDVEWDLANGLPLPDNSCRFIHSEHVIEHLPVEVGIRYFQECRRVLEPGGVVRTAMPSLDFLLEQAVNGDWRDQDWLRWPEYQFIQTRAEMLNIAFRWWEHQWLYDREELHRRLKEAGFVQIADCENRQSNHPELQNLETRPDSRLICEATKH